MGCDIHIYVEQRCDDGSWERVEWQTDQPYTWGPFESRNYEVFGWLADVRNYAAIPPLAQPRGLPTDASPGVHAAVEEWEADGHTHSWFSADELLTFDYDSTYEHRRFRRQTGPNSWDGSATAEAGDGVWRTYREEFGENFFTDLAQLEAMNVERPTRVVFWFDN